MGLAFAGKNRGHAQDYGFEKHFVANFVIATATDPHFCLTQYTRLQAYWSRKVCPP